MAGIIDGVVFSNHLWYAIMVSITNIDSTRIKIRVKIKFVRGRATS